MSCDPRKDLCHHSGCTDFAVGGWDPINSAHEYCEAHRPPSVPTVPAANKTMERELIRILWRQQMLRTEDGIVLLSARVRQGAKEKDLGPKEEPLKLRHIVIW